MNDTSNQTARPAAARARHYEGGELDLFAIATNWKAYWSSVIARYVGPRVLDVGAGIGATADVLRAATRTRWLALEPDPDLSARIRDLVGSGRLPSYVQPECGTLRDVAADERFDTILYVDVLEHIEHDAEELDLAMRYLAPGGFLLIVAPAHQWLYTPFDRAIGHYRRYDRSSLLAIVPATLRIEMLRYIDSTGLLASLGNRLLLRSAHPSPGQIRFWDRVLVPLSRIVDPVLRWRMGKSVVCVLKQASSESERTAPMASGGQRGREAENGG